MFGPDETNRAELGCVVPIPPPAKVAATLKSSHLGPLQGWKFPGGGDLGYPPPVPLPLPVQEVVTHLLDAWTEGGSLNPPPTQGGTQDAPKGQNFLSITLHRIFSSFFLKNLCPKVPEIALLAILGGKHFSPAILRGAENRPTSPHHGTSGEVRPSPHLPLH